MKPALLHQAEELLDSPATHAQLWNMREALGRLRIDLNDTRRYLGVQEGVPGHFLPPAGYQPPAELAGLTFNDMPSLLDLCDELSSRLRERIANFRRIESAQRAVQQERARRRRLAEAEKPLPPCTPEEVEALFQWH